VRGEAAKELLKDEYTGDPLKDNEEFIMAKFTIKYLSNSQNDRSFNVDALSLFNFVSKNWEKYSGNRKVSSVEPKFKDIYAGTETEGYIWCKITKDDVPMVVFAAHSNTDGLWFKTEK